jgi:hypothetical protein
MPMAKQYTSESLLSYLYRETIPQDTRAIQRELALDAILREQFLELDMARREIPKVTFAPSNQSVLRILDYSKQRLIRV